MTDRKTLNLELSETASIALESMLSGYKLSAQLVKGGGINPFGGAEISEQILVEAGLFLLDMLLQNPFRSSEPFTLFLTALGAAVAASKGFDLPTNRDDAAEVERKSQEAVDVGNAVIEAVMEAFTKARTNDSDDEHEDVFERMARKDIDAAVADDSQRGVNLSRSARGAVLCIGSGLADAGHPTTNENLDNDLVVNAAVEFMHIISHHAHEQHEDYPDGGGVAWAYDRAIAIAIKRRLEGE